MKKDFQIDTKIYDAASFQEAIDDYKEVCNISLNKEILTFEGENEDEVDVIFHEFMNYVLSL